MSNVEPLPVGPCEPTVLHRIGRIMAIPLIVAALVLSVIVSPVVFAGFVVACMVFGVLHSGWRWLRNEP